MVLDLWTTARRAANNANMKEGVETGLHGPGASSSFTGPRALPYDQWPRFAGSPLRTSPCTRLWSRRAIHGSHVVLICCLLGPDAHFMWLAKGFPRPLPLSRLQYMPRLLDYFDSPWALGPASHYFCITLLTHSGLHGFIWIKSIQGLFLFRTLLFKHTALILCTSMCSLFRVILWPILGAYWTSYSRNPTQISMNYKILIPPAMSSPQIS